MDTKNNIENEKPDAAESVADDTVTAEDAEAAAPEEAAAAEENSASVADATESAVEDADGSDAAEVEEAAAKTAGDSDTEAGADVGEEAEEEKKTAKKKAAAEKTEDGEKSEGKGAGDVETEEEDENKLPMKWYVIHTYSGHENKVKENILKMVNTSTFGEQFGRLIVPTEEVAEMKKGKKTITTRKFFPSYILIEMFMSDESWHLVNGIPGVTSFVGTGTKPQPLSAPEVERVLGRIDKDKDTIIPEIPFTLGEHIRIKDGPFSDFTGIIDEINAEKGKLRVLVSIFGRETPVELDFLQVETI